ncbi:DNA polymerase III PolC-type-like isoform X1 [Ptychodera flava]|uniref:DNA polymerase III PolC-type-like isoform X1 n=1 Tax=Ptychodera flava TaxID=63121 RepID=UPI00396A8B67
MFLLMEDGRRGVADEIIKVCLVHKENMLSPSRSCQIYGRMLDKKTVNMTEQTKSKIGKLKRIKQREKRANKISATEVREGATYQKDIALSAQAEHQTEEIPEPVLCPKLNPVSCGEYTPVIFDIETTSAYSTAEIIQLSAVSGEQQFEGYILPNQPICRIASEKTHLTVENGKLCYKGKAVQCVPKETCMQKFLYFLQAFDNPILVGHNSRSFDCRYLINSLHDCSLINQFVLTVAGFVDTLPLFRSIYPGMRSYSQESLTNKFVGKEYEAHNTTADVLMLQTLLETCNVLMSILLEHSFTSDWMIQYLHYRKQQSFNYSTLICLVNNKTLSKSMAQKVAGSGLTYRHLHIAYKRGGFESLRGLFTEECGGVTRVTKSEKNHSKCS